jgi:alkylhydroperoxidase/carboxymuconolactone decarboxylase family protein YurZ
MPDPNRDPAPFRRVFEQRKDVNKISQVLRGAVLRLFAPLETYPNTARSPANTYALALEEAFYADGGSPRHRLSPTNRERALIPLLASRGDAVNFAVHVYLGWLEGIDTDEIGELIFLGGIYTGVSDMTRSLDTAARTLEIVYQAGPDKPFEEVLVLLREAFRPGAGVPAP